MAGKAGLAASLEAYIGGLYHKLLSTYLARRTNAALLPHWPMHTCKLPCMCTHELPSSELPTSEQVLKLTGEVLIVITPPSSAAPHALETAILLLRSKETVHAAR